MIRLPPSFRCCRVLHGPSLRLLARASGVGLGTSLRPTRPRSQRAPAAMPCSPVSHSTPRARPSRLGTRSLEDRAARPPPGLPAAGGGDSQRVERVEVLDADDLRALMEPDREAIAARPPGWNSRRSRRQRRWLMPSSEAPVQCRRPLRGRLLLQPHGFEGFSVVHIHVHTGHPPVLQRGDGRDLPRDRDTTRCTGRRQPCKQHDAVAQVDQFNWLRTEAGAPTSDQQTCTDGSRPGRDSTAA